VNKTLGDISQILNPVLETRDPYTSWSEVVNTSQNEGLSFLLYRSAIKKNINIPFSVKQSLKQGYIYNWGRNIRILEELASLLRMVENPVIGLWPENAG